VKSVGGRVRKFLLPAVVWRGGKNRRRADDKSEVRINNEGYLSQKNTTREKERGTSSQ